MQQWWLNMRIGKGWEIVRQVPIFPFEARAWIPETFHPLLIRARSHLTRLKWHRRISQRVEEKEEECRSSLETWRPIITMVRTIRIDRWRGSMRRTHRCIPVFSIKLNMRWLQVHGGWMWRKAGVTMNTIYVCQSRCAATWDSGQINTFLLLTTLSPPVLASSRHLLSPPSLTLCPFHD